MIKKMRYININNKSEVASFREATLKGLGSKKGLFVPEDIPTLPADFFNRITSMNDHEIAVEVLKPYLINDIGLEDLERIVKHTFSFQIPVKHLIGNTHVLELFHGPTNAFKDVGARFMSQCLSLFTTTNKKSTVLVATSGDTGSAVANGFAGVENVDVKILFPKGKISTYQEYQMTSLGGNIHPIEVNGTFDDCQALVKTAFSDEELRNRLLLSSANSINVARFLPQMVYYFLLYKQVHDNLKGARLVVSVPSGNFGNLTAGLYAKEMGLPISKFIAANNENDTFYSYLKSGKYLAKNSVETCSNAMDVGDPSNFTRILKLFGNHSSITDNILPGRVSNEDTIGTIREVFSKHGYILDPHGAVGYKVLQDCLKDNEMGVFLATAHPLKFKDVVEEAIGEFDSPNVSLEGCSKVIINNDYGQLMEVLMS